MPLQLQRKWSVVLTAQLFVFPSAATQYLRELGDQFLHQFACSLRFNTKILTNFVYDSGDVKSRVQPNLKWAKFWFLTSSFLDISDCSASGHSPFSPVPTAWCKDYVWSYMTSSFYSHRYQFIIKHQSHHFTLLQALLRKLIVTYITGARQRPLS